MSDEEGPAAPPDDAAEPADPPGSSSESRDGDDGPDAAEIRHAVALASEAASQAFGWDRSEMGRGAGPSTKRVKPGGGNELSHLIPGYTAPMRLEAKSLRGIAGKSLSELRRRSSRRDAATYNPKVSILAKKAEGLDRATAAKKVMTPSSIAIAKKSGRVTKIPTSFAGSFAKKARRQHDPTAGAGWFGMNPTPMTDQLKTDLAMIRNRNYLDPKRFYKSSDSQTGKVLQVGTVIEGSAEYYSSRLTRKERRQNLTEELMADSSVAGYAKRKYGEMQRERERPARRGGRRGRKRR
ncbi:hypothetical protein ACHAXT_011674 [Thalassiosira profunda]